MVDALQAFHVAQSERSIYFRFFAPLPRLPEKDLARFTHVDHVDRAALVAVAAPLGGEDTGERIIGVARYDRTGPGSAEVAFNIADSAICVGAVALALFSFVGGKEQGKRG